LRERILSVLIYLQKNSESVFINTNPFDIVIVKLASLVSNVYFQAKILWHFKKTVNVNLTSVEDKLYKNIVINKYWYIMDIQKFLCK